MSKEAKRFFFLESHVRVLEKMVEIFQVKATCLLEDHFTKRNQVSNHAVLLLCEVLSGSAAVAASSKKVFLPGKLADGKYEADAESIVNFTQLIKILMETTEALRGENLILTEQ